jgi:hypothetical protein
MWCKEVIDDHREFKHIKGKGCNLTLCGFVDVDNWDVEGIPNCSSCLEIVKYCKKLRIPKEVNQAGLL